MRRALFASCVLATLTVSCERPKQLADGCYYAKGKPVFKIVGDEGRVLIPGEVTAFKVKRGWNARVRFAPGLLFDGVDVAPSFVHAFADAPAYSMKSGTAVPTIEMHWAAAGDEDVYLGKPCQPTTPVGSPRDNAAWHGYLEEIAELNEQARRDQR